MFLTISIIPICPDFKVCRNGCESRRAEAIRFSCCLWDLSTVLIKICWYWRQYGRCFLLQNAAELWHHHPQPVTRLQRIIFLFPGFEATSSFRLQNIFYFVMHRPFVHFIAVTWYLFLLHTGSSLACRYIVQSFLRFTYMGTEFWHDSLDSNVSRFCTKNTGFWKVIWSRRAEQEGENKMWITEQSTQSGGLSHNLLAGKSCSVRLGGHGPVNISACTNAICK